MQTQRANPHHRSGGQRDASEFPQPLDPSSQLPGILQHRPGLPTRDQSSVVAIPSIQKSLFPHLHLALTRGRGQVPSRQRVHPHAGKLTGHRSQKSRGEIGVTLHMVIQRTVQFHVLQIGSARGDDRRERAHLTHQLLLKLRDRPLYRPTAKLPRHSGMRANPDPEIQPQIHAAPH